MPCPLRGGALFFRGCVIMLCARIRADGSHGCRTRASAGGGRGAAGTGGHHGYHSTNTQVIGSYHIHFLRKGLSSLALVFLLFLVPRYAYAAPSLEVDGNFAGYEDGEEYKGYVVVDSPDNYQSTLCLIGEWSKLVQITTEQYEILSNPSTGGAFYELSQLWRKLGSNASGTEEYYPQWLALSEDFANGLVTVYGYGKVWAVVCTNELIEQAKSDFNTIIGGGSVGGEPDQPVYEDGSYEYVSESQIIFHMVPNYTYGEMQIVAGGTTYYIYNDLEQYNQSNKTNKHYVQNVNVTINASSSSVKFKNITTYYALNNPANSSFFYQVDNGIEILTGTTSGHSYKYIHNSTGSPLNVYYCSNITPLSVSFDDTVMNITSRCSSASNGSMGSTQSAFITSYFRAFGGAASVTPEPEPEPSPDPWEPPSPSPDPPSNPSTPTPKDPITPDPPSLPGAPSDPVQPAPPQSPTVGNGGTFTLDIQGILDALDEHCIHIQTCLNSNFSGQNSYLGQLFSTYTAAIVDQIYDGDVSKIGAIGDLQNTVTQGFNDILSYWDDYVEWLDKKLDFKWPETDSYDDADLLNWLRKIWARQGTGDVNTRPVDPATNYGGMSKWLGVLYGKIAGDVSDTSLTALSSSLNALQHTFPFSLPWDIQQILQALDATPATPAASITVPALAGAWDAYSYDIDLHWMDTSMVAVRGFELLAFVLYCLIHTKDVFGYVVGD